MQAKGTVNLQNPSLFPSDSLTHSKAYLKGRFSASLRSRRTKMSANASQKFLLNKSTPRARPESISAPRYTPTQQSVHENGCGSEATTSERIKPPPPQYASRPPVQSVSKPLPVRGAAARRLSSALLQSMRPSDAGPSTETNKDQGFDRQSGKASTKPS